METLGSEIGLPRLTPMAIFNMSMIEYVDVRWKYNNHERKDRSIEGNCMGIMH